MLAKVVQPSDKPMIRAYLLAYMLLIHFHKEKYKNLAQLGFVN